jgi:hypothetical protein
MGLDIGWVHFKSHNFSVPSADMTAILKSKYWSLHGISLVRSGQSLKNMGSDTCNKKKFISVRSEVLMMVMMNILLFWYVMLHCVDC